MRPQLLFITNPKNSDPEEDIFLANELRDTFDVTVSDPRNAILVLPQFSRCLIRNAWPSRLFKNEFIEIRHICTVQNIKTYNPFHRNGYIEDKTYLVDLFQQGYPVIPTVDSKDSLEKMPVSSSYIIKPKDGCSSDGVESLTREELRTKDCEGYLIQPEVGIVDEISLYFVDDAFEYATVSAGKDQRWELSEHQPTSEEMTWAKRFVEWNRLPYGIQRIDGCRTKDQRLLLMEIESDMPMLTLSDISEESRNRFLMNFKRSLQKNLQ